MTHLYVSSVVLISYTHTHIYPHTHTHTHLHPHTHTHTHTHILRIATFIMIFKNDTMEWLFITKLIPEQSYIITS